jgi:hypothetical protein
MSERMIELQRARLGLPPPTSSTHPITSVQADRNSTTSVAQSAPTLQQRHSSHQQAAAQTVDQEDEKLSKFVKRLHQQQREGGTTVPTSLARRMLHRQGVGYLDDTVAMLTAAAGDRFLASVLQQGLACRDRRLSGQERSQVQSARRRKYVSLYQQDSEYRKRRKMQRTSQKLQAHVAALAAAQGMNEKSNLTDNKDTTAKKKLSKKNEQDEVDTNGTKMIDQPIIDDDEILDDDSMDEEELYYEEYYGEPPEVNDDDDADEDDQVLLLRDLERPLEAWHFKLTGKVGLGAIPIEASKPNSTINGESMAEPENYEDEEEGDEDDAAENGETNSYIPKPSPKKQGKQLESNQEASLLGTSTPVGAAVTATSVRLGTSLTNLSPGPK